MSISTHYHGSGERAVHIFTNNDLDSKFASSLMYEYFKRYRNDVNKYFIHYTENNALTADICADDVIILIKHMIYDDETLDELNDILTDMHEVIWIDNSFESNAYIFTEKFCKFKKDWSEWFSYDCDTSFSATLITYSFIMRALERSYASNPHIINMIDDYIMLNNIYNHENIVEFSYGILAQNITTKNAIRTILNHNNELDIFDISTRYIKAEKKFIKSMIDLGAQLKLYYELSNKDNSTMIVICDLINDACFHICAINTDSNNPYMFNDKLNIYDAVCLYNKNRYDKWEYRLYAIDGITCNCAILAKYFDIDKTKMNNNTRNYATFYSNACLFDYGNEIIIKKKLFSNNHKLIISKDGIAKSIIF